MTTSIAHLLFVAGSFAYLAIRIAFKRRLGRQCKSESRSGAVDRALIAGVVLGQFALPSLFLATPLLGVADWRLPPAATWIGAAFMTGGLWLFWRSHADLGDSWSVTLELNPEHRPVTAGVYRWIRHPMYASFFLMAAAQALLLENAVAGPSAALAVLLLYLVRKPREEAMMRDHFAATYEAYVQRTGGVVPRLRAVR